MTSFHDTAQPSCAHDPTRPPSLREVALPYPCRRHVSSARGRSAVRGHAAGLHSPRPPRPRAPSLAHARQSAQRDEARLRRAHPPHQAALHALAAARAPGVCPALSNFRRARLRRRRLRSHRCALCAGLGAARRPGDPVHQARVTARRPLDGPRRAAGRAARSRGRRRRRRRGARDGRGGRHRARARQRHRRRQPAAAPRHHIVGHRPVRLSASLSPGRFARPASLRPR